MPQQYNPLIVPKTAVVIADSLSEPFCTIKKNVHPKIWQELNSRGVDIFYVSGTCPNRLNRLLNVASEKLRYSKYWPLQYSFDRFSLAKYNFVQPKVSVVGSEISVNLPDGLRTLGIKMFSTYNVLFDLGYEVVFKTTLSSLVNVDLFTDFINNLPQERAVYAGKIIRSGDKTFASGANTFLNRKSLELVSNRIRGWDNGKLDDVALGKVLNDLPRVEISTLNLDSLEILENISDRELSSTLHFRCKSSSKSREDVQIIRELLVRLSQSTSD